MDPKIYSPALWVKLSGLVNEKGDPLEFKDHFFLWDIYADLRREQVIKKCAQIGLSVCLNIKAFHLAKYRNIATIYTMPSDDDVSKFVKTKTDKIFHSNPIIRKGLITDSVSIKQVGNNFIRYKGTRSKSAPIADTADLLIHDEVDRSDLNIVEQYRSRISFSKYKGIWLVSNPSIAKMGVDAEWGNSDQKEWFIICSKCKHDQYLVWEENVDEINMRYVCKSCGKELTKREIRDGKWKPLNPGAEMSGYHISQMMAPWLTAKELIKEKETRGTEYFKNFVLGEPYQIGDVADFRQMITDCYTSNPLDEEPFIMGIDIGIEKHYVLGSKKGIFKIGKVKTRKELEAIIDRYDPIIVMDAGPERTWAEEFKEKYPKCHLCFYRKDTTKAELVKWGGLVGGNEDEKNHGYVWTDRNRAINAVIDEFLNGKILIYLSREDLNKYILQWETLRRIMEPTALGTKSYKWESTTGEDHWAHATVYYWIARGKTSSADIISEPEINKSMIERTPDGFKMRDLKEVIEENQMYE